MKEVYMNSRKMMFLLMIAVLAFGTAAAGEEEQKTFLDNLKMSGSFTLIAKSQTGFATPLDSPEMGIFNRAGANYRASQNIRAHGLLNFSLGTPGVSPWFGVLQLRIDANDPDVDYYFNPADPGNSDRERTEEIVEVNNFFVMYRPFEMKGGRPFGISVGINSVKATANAAYTHLYIGDTEDEDFIFYTAAALTTFPMIQADFHITPETGIGFALARGAGDISLIGTGMNPDSALNKILWAEAQKGGFGFNGAIQFVAGESGGTKLTETDNDNTIYEYEGKYKHRIYNSRLSYTYKGLQPYVGFQLVQGDEVPSNEAFEPREVKGSFWTYGFVADKILGPGKLCADFTKAGTNSFDGLQGLPKGLLAGILSETSLASLAPYFTQLGGDSSVIYAVSHLDYAFHAEYALPLKKGLDLSFFYYGLRGKKDNTLSSETVESDIADALRPYEGVGGFIAEEVAAQLMAGGLNNQVEAIRRFAEWTNTDSFGLAVKYSF